MNNNEQIEKYLSRLEKALQSISTKERLEIVSKIESHIHEAMAKRNESLEKIFTSLGRPEDVAGNYLSNKRIKSNKLQINFNRKLLLAGSIGIVMLLFFTFLVRGSDDEEKTQDNSIGIENFEENINIGGLIKIDEEKEQVKIGGLIDIDGEKVNIGNFIKIDGKKGKVDIGDIIKINGNKRSSFQKYPTSKVKGSGNLKIERRDISKCDSINLQVPGTVKVTIGKKIFVKITTDDNIPKYLQLNFNNDSLTIESDHSLSPSKLIIESTTPYVSSLKISGSGKIIGLNQILSDHLKLKIAGSGSINGNVSAKNIDLKISGSGNVQKI